MTAAPRVLVVVDDRSNRAVAGRVLTGAGYRVTAVASAAEAIKAIDVEGSFDLYVIDVRMPGESGIALADSIRRSRSDARILYWPDAIPDSVP